MRIMTGAPLPAGADAVVPVELTDQLAGDHPLPTSVVIREAVAQGRHIRRAGENAAVGDVVLNKGMKATQAAAAAATSIGYSHLLRTDRPHMSVIAKRQEIRTPGKALDPREITN